jgi:hypothetical protein
MGLRGTLIIQSTFLGIPIYIGINPLKYYIPLYFARLVITYINTGKNW